MKKRSSLPIFAVCIMLLAGSVASLRAAPDDALETNFANPPDSARPWVYWFWNNGNVTKAGITADLEAMKRVGIGGVLIMDVVERFAPPEGPATYMGPLWVDLYRFALSEANRLGLEMNMTNAPGWCGSSDPAITPELSMQTLTITGTFATGPAHFDCILPRAESISLTRRDAQSTVIKIPDYYKDVAVLAFPAPTDGTIPRGKVIDVSSKMTPDGHLVWDVPAGTWTIQRYGEVSTGSSTRPPVLGGVGLECDKLCRAAMDLHWATIMKKLIDVAGPLAGKTLVATHIDSWEVGSQNWTPLLQAEFQKRRRYDVTPYLPCVLGKLQIGDKATSDRVRRDFHETTSELLAENYTGHIAELAHQSGLRFTLEGYELPFGDEATYTAAADEPMTEFWTPGPYAQKITVLKAHQMASVAHLYGRPVVGAESFTSAQNEEWKQHPATIKALGDYEMCQGVSRFVFHRYAFQPYLDRFPGATMGPWGLHYERTNTWWDWSLPWHQYVARCSYMLRQGLFVADLVYARPELPDQTYFNPIPAPPAGHNYDEASAEAIMDRASVKDGRIVLPDGMSYRLLVLPPTQKMTPEFLHKLDVLVAAGATISGPPPLSSPSLTNYPQCDDEVATLAKKIWGDCDGKRVTEHAYGKGRVFWGRSVDQVLAMLDSPPDFTAGAKLNWIHRHTPQAEIYFVANPEATPVAADCTFRTPGLRPELWNPEDGTFAAATVSATSSTSESVPIRLEPSGSTFVVFRPPNVTSAHLTVPMGQTVASGTIPGPWEVRFPPNWDAPPTVTFPSLISWSDSTIAGVRYFSGTGTYHKTFTADAAWLQAGRRVVLDLGDVQIMARLKLNGRDFGIAWKPPYRFEITGALKPGANEMEISVVNLWPNRMTGDAGLPANQRLTWSSWEPFTKDSPLLESGLIGPVTVGVE